MPISWLPTALVDVWEESEANSFSYKDTSSATVTLRCAWADRFTVLEDILFNGGTYPYLPGALMYAQEGSCVPASGQALNDGEGLTYEHALVTIKYTNDKDDNGSGDIISESLEPHVEFMSLDPAEFRWGSASGDALNAEEAPGRLIVGFDYVQTEYNLVTLPTTIITELGKCNSGTIAASLLGISFAAETLLFASATPSRKIDSAGNAKWTLAKRFSFRPTEWNKFWRGKTQSWESIYIAGGSIYRNFPTSGTLPIV